jgi:hypothetical protein
MKTLNTRFKCNFAAVVELIFNNNISYQLSEKAFTAAKASL